MGAELLDRHSRPLSLTVYGGNLIQYAVPLVVDLDGLIGAIRPGTGRYPLVTAGYSESVSATSAPWLTSYLETRSDKVVVQTGMTAELIEAFLNDDIDILIVPDPLLDTDGLWRQKVYEEEFQDKFQAAGLHYRYALIDDVAAKVIRSEGGMIWACKNYDGDVMSDLIAAASGSLPMMTSVLVSPDGNFEYEAAHGTITDHYRRHQKGEALSSNPLATIAAWAGALKKRGELDGNAALVRYADCLGQAGLDVFEEGYLSEDLASLCDPKELKEMPENGKLMKLIRARLETLLA